jgi:hypothetical protein
MDIGNQQRVIVVEPIDIDEAINADQAVPAVSHDENADVAREAEEQSITPTLQTD